MTTLAMQRNELMPHGRDGIKSGLLLAALVHVALVGALAFGVSWRASEPAGVEAELWAAVPQIAAQRDVAPEPPPKPMPVKPEPKPEPTPKVQAPDPQIAIERARQEKLKKKEEEKREQQEKEKLDKKRALEDKTKLAKADADKQKKLDEQRDKNLARIKEMMGVDNGSPNSTASQTKGPSASYGGLVRAAIYPKITFIRATAGNPIAEVEVRAASDGTILSRRVVKSSGVAEWDEAVLDAIDKTKKLPRDTDGTVPSAIVITFKREG